MMLRAPKNILREDYSTTETDGFIDRAREHVESDERRWETQAKNAYYLFEEGKTHLAQTDVNYVVPNSLLIQARG